MKKLLSIFLVLLALSVAAFFFIKLRRFLPERARAADLAPAGTVLYVQVPNLRETAFRVPGLDLYAIWMEPDVQAFLEKPRKKSPWMAEWQDRFDEVVRVAPGEMFIAFTATGAHPEFVGGFSFAGSRHSAEALLEKSRSLLPGNLVSRPRDNWLFFASDAAGLETIVARFDGKNAEPGIGGDPAFQKAVKALGVAPDLVVYGRSDALPALTTAAPKATFAALSTKIQKGKLHDTIFLPEPGAAASPAAPQQTFVFTSPQTLLYSSSDLASLPGASDLTVFRTLLPQIGVAEQALAAKGLTWADLPAAFGPEVGAVVEWPEDAALPQVFLAPQVRDKAKAAQFVEAITAPNGQRPGWPAQEIEGVNTFTTTPQGIALLRPTLALTEHFALAAVTPEAMAVALARQKKPVSALTENAAFQEATRLFPGTPNSLLYLDFPHLFERLYRMARPFITLSLAFSGETGTQFDAGKLPPVEAISKHLGPLVVTQTRQENGLLIESTGSITATELVLGASAGAMASGLSKLPGQFPALRSLTSPAPRTSPRSAVPSTPAAAKDPAQH